jgi:hypothetical protein
VVTHLTCANRSTVTNYSCRNRPRQPFPQLFPVLGEQRGDLLVPLGDLTGHGTAQLAGLPVRLRLTGGCPASCLPAFSHTGHPFACAQPDGCTHTAGYQLNWNPSRRLAASRWIEAQTG